MKKASILTSMIVFIAMSTFSQTPATSQNPASSQARPAPPSPEERAKMQTERLREALDLTPEQYKKIVEINKDFNIKMKSAKPTPGQPPSQEEENKRRAIFDDKEGKINAILTAEQRTKLEASKKNAADRMEAPYNTPNPGK